MIVRRRASGVPPSLQKREETRAPATNESNTSVPPVVPAPSFIELNSSTQASTQAEEAFDHPPESPPPMVQYNNHHIPTHVHVCRCFEDVYDRDRCRCRRSSPVIVLFMHTCMLCVCVHYDSFAADRTFRYHCFVLYRMITLQRTKLLLSYDTTLCRLSPFIADLGCYESVCTLAL